MIARSDHELRIQDATRTWLNPKTGGGKNEEESWIAPKCMLSDPTLYAMMHVAAMLPFA
jgi:hypothetical protein